MPEIYGTRSRKMEVTYDYYRIFYYAAKYKSFSQAATILMSNQPNVTRAIHNLESQLGCRLFIRSNRGAELTPEVHFLHNGNGMLTSMRNGPITQATRVM